MSDYLNYIKILDSEISKKNEEQDEFINMLCMDKFNASYEEINKYCYMEIAGECMHLFTYEYHIINNDFSITLYINYLNQIKDYQYDSINIQKQITKGIILIKKFILVVGEYKNCKIIDIKNLINGDYSNLLILTEIEYEKIEMLITK